MADLIPPQMFVTLINSSQEICLLRIPSAKILLKKLYLFFSLFFNFQEHTSTEKYCDIFHRHAY